jgi:rhodanese-related sulfurtransferase
MTHAISANDMQNLPPGQCVILDVRTKMEHDEKHVGLPHVHIPLDQLDPAQFMRAQGLSPDTRVYLLCRSGGRATQAAQKFIASGFPNVTVIEGGIVACEGCGMNIQGYGAEKSGACCAPPAKRPISLERQVRIAAGLFAFTGAALGLLLHPAFTLIPLFVGGGLVFAGVTDRCGMALVLTKAPWNNV